MLSSMGVEVVDERPYELDGLDRPTYIYEFGLRYGGGLPDNARELFQDAIRAVWDGFNEIDGFNALVLAAGADLAPGDAAARVREVHAPGRARRSPSTTSRRRCATTSTSPGCWCGSSRPASTPALDRTAGDGEAAVEERIARALDDVASLDHDRILRSYLTHIRATLRTNYFQPAARRRRPAALHLAQAGAGPDPGPAGAAAEVRDLRLLAAGRGLAPALRRRRPRQACAGRTAATTSAPRCWVWSRRRW